MFKPFGHFLIYWCVNVVNGKAKIEIAQSVLNMLLNKEFFHNENSIVGICTTHFT